MNEFAPATPLRIPVLLLIFNRPDTTRQVFEAIRQAKPPRLYVAADGPRTNKAGEAERCALTREIATAVDWECEVKTLFRDQNLGCGVAPANAIDWFFENEEEGIILEDDCLPHQSFFWYCQELLDKYRHDTRVMHITGTNFHKGWQRDPDYSYYFSAIGLGWGWASWRRAWAYYDFNINHFPEVVKKNYLDGFFFKKDATTWLLNSLKETHEKTGDISWWDFQWDFIRYTQSGLAIVPNSNLIENIGIGEDATHTVKADDKLRNPVTTPMSFPLRHPGFVIRDHQSDERYFQNFYARNSVEKAKAFVKMFIPDFLLEKMGISPY
jgi:hypothetical protein